MDTVAFFIVALLMSFVVNSNGHGGQALFLPTILSRNLGHEGALRWTLPETEASDDLNSSLSDDFSSTLSDNDSESETDDLTSEIEATGPVETSWLIDPEWFMVEDSIMSDNDLNDNSDLDDNENNIYSYNDNENNNHIYTSEKQFQETIPTLAPMSDIFHTELYDPSWRVVEDIVDSNNLRHIVQ